MGVCLSYFVVFILVVIGVGFVRFFGLCVISLAHKSFFPRGCVRIR